MATRKSEWLAMIKPILDKEGAKKDALALAKELEGVLNVKVNTDQNDLSELTAIFNQKLQEMGKQPVVFSQQTLRGIVSQFTQAISQGISQGVSDGAKINIQEQMNQLKAQREKLVQQQKALNSRMPKYERLTDIPYMEQSEFKAFSKEDLGKMGKDINQVATRMYQELTESQQHLSTLQSGTREFNQALLDFYSRARNVFKMSRTLSQSPGLVSDENILQDYNWDSLQKVFNGEDNKHSLESYNSAFSAFIKQQQKLLDSIPAKLKNIESQIASLQSNEMGIIDIRREEKGLKTLNEIEAAYKRLKRDKGVALKDQSLQHLNTALQYQAKEKDGIQTFAKQYRDAAGSGDWVEEYHALLRYVKLYESYLNSENKTHRNKVTKSNNPYTPLYEQLKPMEETARNMLQNIVNMGEGKPLIGMGGPEAEKVASASQVSASAARNEADAKSKAKGAAEATLKANQESAAAVKEELSSVKQTTAELEKQQKLLLYRRVDGEFDPNRISSRSTDALYDKQNQPTIQQALELGFGGFGDGLYSTISRAAGDLLPVNFSDKASFFEFDASGYNLFINKTAEQAEALRSFLLSLQKFVGAGTILDASQLTDIADLSQDQLFENANKIFKNFSMTKSQFDAWITSAKQESEIIAEMFAKGQVPTNRHNFGTRFMQTLGYDGVLNDTGNLDYDGNYHGSVIYDPDADKIRHGFNEGMHTFASSKEFAAYLEKQITTTQNATQAQEQLNQAKSQEPKPVDDTSQLQNEAGVVTQQIQSYEQLCQVVERYNQLVAQKGIKQIADIGEFNDIADQLNGVVSEDQLKQFESPLDANALAQRLGIEIPQAAKKAEGAINGVAAAQEQLNVVERQSPQAQDESAVHDANTEAIKKEIEAKTKLAILVSRLDSAIKFPSLHEGEVEAALQSNPNLVADLVAQRDVMRQTMQPVNDMASRISKMSSIKNIPLDDLYAEAANVGQKLSTMYDDGIRDTEEYVALQYKLINIFEKLSASYGGVKGSGAIDRSDLYRMIGDSVEQRTGYNPMQSSALDAIWGQEDFSIAKTANQMFGLKEMSARMLRYSGEELGFKWDQIELSQFNTVIDALSKIQQSSNTTKTSVDELNTSLEKKNAIENADNGAVEAAEENSETQAIQQQNQALKENINLKTQTDTRTVAQDGVGVAQGGVVNDGGADVSAEATQLTNLQNVLASITTAVGAKTQAFTAEEKEVARVVGAEIKSLDLLEQKVLSIKGQLEGLLSNLKTGQSDVGAGLGNITVTVNKADGVNTEQNGAWALDTTVQSVRTSLDGVRTDLGNIITAIGNINAQPAATGEEATFATETTLSAVKALLDVINGKIVAGTKGGSGKQSGGKTESSAEKKPETSKKKTNSTETGKKDEAAQAKHVEALQKEIGARKGELANTTNEGVRQALQEEIALRERIIQLIHEGSSMSSQEEVRQITDLSEKTKAAKVAAKEEEKAQKKAIADQQKAEKKAYNDFVKETRKEAGLTQARSVMNKADESLKGAALIDNATPEATAKFTQLDAALQQLKQTYAEINSKPGPVDPKDQERLIAQRENVQQLQGAVAQLVEEHQRLNGVNAQQIGTTSLGLGASSESQQKAITDAVMAATQGRAAIKGFNAETNELTYTLKTGANQFTTFKAAIDKTNGSIMTVRGNTTKAAGVFATLGRKMKEYSYYFTGSMMIFRAVAWVREGITAIKDIDAALTELKKVTDTTEESYENFLETASKTADKVGSTIKDVVSSTADWARLGYTMKEATELATSTQILMNVSEFDDVSKATDSLISSIQAFKYTAEESMDVVDILNTIGNNYAISTADLAESLTKSSGSLVAANGTLEEAVALTAAANTIIQDSDVVGTALKTVAMRLRGTSVEEMEEEGLDTDGAVESKSKLQSKIQALSGVNILTDAGAYKSTYQILSEIANVWEDMNDMDQAALLELLAGKRAGSTMAAILENPDILKDAFESANDASGSALKENETYLDSIQGRIDLFTNAVQTMWQNAIDNEFIKFLVDVGTWLIKLVDNIGLINSALIVTSLVLMKVNHMNLIEFFADISKYITGAATKIVGFGKGIAVTYFSTAKSIDVATVSSLKNAMAVANVDAANKEAIISQLGLTGANNAQKISRDSLNASTLSAMVAEGKLTQAQANTIMSLLGIKVASNEVTAARMNEILTAEGLDKVQRKQIITQLGLSGSLKKLNYDEVVNALTTAGMSKQDAIAIAAKLGLSKANIGLAASFYALWTAMWPVLLVMLAIAAVVGVVKLFDALTVSAKESSEQLEDTKNKISDLESELESLQDDLDETKSKIAELVALPSLSLTQQEDLDRLEKEVELLERQIALKERQLAVEEAKLIEDTEVAIKKNWGSTDKNKKDKKKLNKYITQYEEKSAKLKVQEDLYTKASKEVTEGQGMSYESWKQIRTAQGYDDDQTTQAAFEYESYGWSDIDKQTDLISWLDKEIQKSEADLTNLGSKIEDIFNDPTYAGLEYGMSDEIDAFLDDYNNAQLRWEKALYGDNSTASIIESLWGPNASEEMKTVKAEIDKIMAADGNWSTDEEKWQKKNDAIKAYIDSLDKTAEGYHQLNYVMTDLGKTSQDIADYFTVLNGEFNSNTIEGIAAQYGKGTEVLLKLKNNEKISYTDNNGNAQELGFEDLFSGGKVDEADVAKVLQGLDKQTREEFAKVIQTVQDSKEQLGEEFNFEDAMNTAIESFNLSGARAVIELQKKELEQINIDLFPNLEDEISGIIDTFGELAKAVGSVVDAMDTLEQARAEEAYSGSVSLETLEKLMASTDNYADLIEVDETGAIKLAADAQDILAQQKIETIKTNAQLALSEAQQTLAEAEHNEQIYKETGPAQQFLRGMLTKISGAMAYVSEMWAALKQGDFANAGSRARAARETALASQKESYESKAEAATTGVAKAKKQVEDAEKMVKIANGLSVDNIKQRYDSNEASGGNDTVEDVRNDAFQKEMDYWENRIAANQARYEQIQNEIDLMEKKGQKADVSYYQEQEKLEQERLLLLQQQRAEAQKFIDGYWSEDGVWIEGFEEGTEEWWEWANVINDIEGEIDDVTASLVDTQDAIGEIDAYKFEEFNNRLDNLTSKLETIRNLIAPNGEEDWFDDEGNWTESGVAVLGAHIQELKFDEEGLKKAEEELNKYSFSYEGNEDYYEGLGIHSEQEYYDKVEELTDQRYQFAESISDTKQSIVDMYESSIDAVEEYIDTLIDGYNDYIDSVKEALDAERELYDFKKNVQKQAKDISELERRIASLSGSTNAADIAERRKLEAQLYESRESLNDAYYDHAQESQQNALDAEQEAYEETMTKFVEGLRTSLDEATANMDEFLMGVTSMVMYNADTVLAKYEETNLPLTQELTNPWEEAMEATNSYSGNALDLMNQWTKEGGFFAQFNATGTENLQSPWSAGINAATNFGTDVGKVMTAVVSNIATNVSTASGELSRLYEQIQDTAARAASVEETVNQVVADSNAALQTVSANASNAGQAGRWTSYQDAASAGFSGVRTNGEFNRNNNSDKIKYGTYQAYLDAMYEKYLGRSPFYAKGTLGTKRDGFAITDESWIGEEITLAAGKNGQLQYLKKGSAVMPADISANLVEWGKLDPRMLNLTNPAGVSIITNAINKPEINLSFEALVKAERIDENTLPEVKRYVQQEINTLVKSMNYAIKGKGGR